MIRNNSQRINESDIKGKKVSMLNGENSKILGEKDKIKSQIKEGKMEAEYIS